MIKTAVQKLKTLFGSITVKPFLIDIVLSTNKKILTSIKLIYARPNGINNSMLTFHLVFGMAADNCILQLILIIN